MSCGFVIALEWQCVNVMVTLTSIHPKKGAEQMQRISIRLNQDEALLMSAVLSSPAVAGIVPRDWGIHCQLGGACWARTLGLPAAVLILPAAVLIQAGPQRIPACLVCADYLTH